MWRLALVAIAAAAAVTGLVLSAVPGSGDPRSDDRFFTAYYTRWSAGPDPSGNPRYFPIGVWEPNDDSYAAAYGRLGVTISVNAQGTVGWPNFFGDSSARANVAHYLSDEPDMNQVNYGSNNPLTAPRFSTDAAAAKTADPSRPTYANFGKCFSEPNWAGCNLGIQSPAATSVSSMDAQYCRNVDILSADYYGYTDPYDALTNGTEKNYGAWTYGAEVASVHSICGAQKPVFVFVETGRPWPSSSKSITPNEVTAATWDGIMHGANGVIYFDHDFSGIQSDDGMVEGGPESTTVAPIVRTNDAEISALAPWLNQPNQPGVKVKSTRGVPVTTMLKKYSGRTYLFAMADGNGSLLNSGSTTATISVPGSVAVTDTFGPYQVHVYQMGHTPVRLHLK